MRILVVEDDAGAPRPNTLQQVKIAIAQRVLASAGGSVELYSNGRTGFAIRMPQTQIGCPGDRPTA